MRKPIIAGNWKMYKTLGESIEFAREIAPRLAATTGVERVICPPFVSLAAVANELKNSGIFVGAQNVHWEAQGAFTSQISPAMLQGIADHLNVPNVKDAQGEELAEDTAVDEIARDLKVRESNESKGN